MFERYTEGARRSIFFARFEASRSGGSAIETEHLLLGLLREDHALAERLRQAGASEESIRRQVERRYSVRPSLPTSTDMPLSEECKRALTYAAEEADRLKSRHIGNEHLFLGLLRVRGSFAAKILGEHGVDYSSLGKGPFGSYESGAERSKRWTELLDDTAAQAPAGAYWGAGYVRKTQSLSRLFHWERRLVQPRAALVKRGAGSIALYTGQPYDAAEFDLVQDGWQHDHCVMCWRRLYLPDRPADSFGYTSGQEWLCERCYAAWVASPQP